MLDDVGAVVADVLAEEGTGNRIVGLDAAVVALDTISAEHYQIGSDIIPGMFEHVVKREAPDGSAQGAVPPLEVQVAQQDRVPNAGSWLGVDQVLPPCLGHSGSIACLRQVQVMDSA